MDKPQVHRRVNVKYTTKGVAYTEATFTLDQEDDPDYPVNQEIEYRERAIAFFQWVDKVWPPPVES